MKKRCTIQTTNSHSFLMQWPAEDADDAIFEMLGFLKKKYAQEILEMVPTYRELGVYLHAGVNQEKFLKRLDGDLPLSEKTGEAPTPGVIYEVPVCYDTEKGLDIEHLAKAKEMAVDEIIELHTSVMYTIHFIGFLPGFPYLSGLADRLHHPRLSNPRAKIPKGSVGIAGAQTGIYPTDSPGGWNIIGQTPIPLFSVDQNPPATFQAGNKLRFVAVDAAEYREIEAAVKSGFYKIETRDG